MAWLVRHGVCAISLENPAFLTPSCRNDRRTLGGTVPRTPDGSSSTAPGLEADDAAAAAEPAGGPAGRPRSGRPLPTGGRGRPAAVVRPDRGAERPLGPRRCLGWRWSAPSPGSERRGRASAGCPAGGWPGRPEGAALGAVGAGRAGSAPGGVRGRTIVVPVP